MLPRFFVYPLSCDMTRCAPFCAFKVSLHATRRFIDPGRAGESSGADVCWRP